MKRVKTTVRALHRWAGLFLAVYLLFQSLSGVLLVYRHELQALGTVVATTDSMGPPAFSIDVVIDDLATTFPGYSIHRIYYPVARGEPAIAHLQSPGSGGTKKLVEIDPETGALHAAGRTTRSLEWLFDLHHQLAMGKSGSYVVGAAGLVLTLLALSGLWLWWPGPGRVRLSFGNLSLRATGVRQLYDWHRLAGSIAFPVILVTAISGAMLVYGPALQSAFNLQVGATRAIDSAANESPTRGNDWLVQALAVIDQGGVRDLRFELGTNTPQTVVMYRDNWLRSGPFKRVRLHEQNAAVVGITSGEGAGPLATLIAWSYSLHSRLGLARLGQLLLATGAGALMLLAISGPLFWWRKRQRRRVSTVRESRT